jgi:hypothetical protein
MSFEIATITFYILVFVTVTLQLSMHFRRAKFLRAIKEQQGPLINLKGPRIERFVIMLQIFLPIKLATGNTEAHENLRKSAVRASIYWVISMLLTFILPVILFNLTDAQ